MSETESKEERKERKRLKKLAKEAKRAAKNSKKRKLEESDVEEPETKKRKLNEEEATEQEPNGVEEEVSEFAEITKIIVKATKDQLQNALLQCAKQSPSSIPEMEKNLEATEIDADLTALLTEQRETAAADPAGAADATPAAAGDDATPSAGKITGVVQKWRHEKGYGFITRDDGKGDVFCHANEVWAVAPHRNPQTGSKVEFELEQGEKGESAKNVCAVGGAECPGGRASKGTIAKWIEDREFGFITMDDGQDLFIGNRDVWESAGMFNQGDRVEFDIKYKDDGRMQATYCTLEGNRCIQCSSCEGVGHMSRDCPGYGAEEEAAY